MFLSWALVNVDFIIRVGNGFFKVHTGISVKSISHHNTYNGASQWLHYIKIMNFDLVGRPKNIHTYLRNYEETDLGTCIFLIICSLKAGTISVLLQRDGKAERIIPFYLVRFFHNHNIL